MVVIGRQQGGTKCDPGVTLVEVEEEEDHRGRVLGGIAIGRRLGKVQRNGGCAAALFRKRGAAAG